MPLNDPTVTRFSNGVTNAALDSIFSSMMQPDPLKYHEYLEDFDTYNASDWTVTETDAAATEALTDGDGGLLLITNTAADDDLVALQKKGESFLLATGAPTFFRCRFKVSDATQSDLVFGLQITDTTPLAVTDGLYFQKDDGDTHIDFHAVKNSVAVDATDIAELANNTFVSLGFFWDGVSRVYYSVNGTVLGYITPGASLCDDEELTISFALQNGEAVAKTMTVDYLYCAKQR